MHKSIRSWGVAGVSMLGLLSVAACGDSDGPSAASTASSAVKATTTTAAPVKNLKVAVVAPSAPDDMAFSQPMMEALAQVVAERGAGFTELQSTTGMYEVAKARDAVIGYARSGVDIIIVHSDEFGPIVQEVAPQYPDISFVWGTEIDTFGLPNVYSYGLAADEGAYVMGVLAAGLTKSDNVGIVGPMESGDAKLFVDGFTKGVHDTDPKVKTASTYIDSFSDVVKAAKAAEVFTDDGADVLTGSSEAMAGALPVVVANHAVWFGNQWEQTSLAPDAVVASQVYHFENMLRDVFSRVESGQRGGAEFELNLANDGLVIQYNPGFKLPQDVRAKGDAAEKAIEDGTLQVGL